MADLFVYGTLRHVPLLAAVLDRPADKIDMVIGTLPGHRVNGVVGEDFPILSVGEGTAEGLLLRNLSQTDVDRLDFYEGGYDYALKPVDVVVGGAVTSAQVYFSESAVWQPEGDWSLKDWSERHGSFTVHKAMEEMSYFGSRSRREVDRMLPTIKARASAKVLAESGPIRHNPSGFDVTDIEIHRLERPYANFFAIEEVDVSFRRYDGSMSQPVNRAVFMGTDAALVLPYDPVRDKVLLVEQFRLGPTARGDRKVWQLEPIAGRVDGGETPEATAHREAQEEAGLTLQRLEEVGSSYASPGGCTEYFHLYVGITNLPDDVIGVSGLEDEAEDIRSYLYSYDALMELVDRRELDNAPLILMALWLSRHRERLRAGA
ncbi:nudix-type nucleoside diphosphatase (YffH/AdpP family) [Shimia isoporae]|uniref:ADP-ribose pyrophosphatase n=1 Tax=Shimia isoporae TaxID=647720 RepID=A0A4R1NM76_9RHOB|nr:NUDIX domain-containing protein [Shimia isoporae]TCL09516.1 nudix-type nucleoside diphosphatase (YffH/AdpP family) [Shimia isoporae]